MDYTYKGFGPGDDEESYDWPEMLCEICNRWVCKITRHHLTPKARGGAKGDTINVCLSCAEMIHQLIPNKELEREYDTLEKLLANEKIKKYAKWIGKQKKERVTIARKKRRL